MMQPMNAETPSGGDVYALCLDDARNLPSGGDLASYLGLNLLGPLALGALLFVNGASVDAQDLVQRTGAQGVAPIALRPQSQPVADSRPVGEQLQDVQAALALNKSELAAMLGVARPTIYEWLAGKDPSAANSTRLTRILRALRRAGVSGSRPLNARFVRAPREDGATLLSALGAETLDESVVARMLRETREQGDAADRARLARETGRRERGYEVPTVDERRESLAGIVAELPWPKG
jgi:hypothetical protein